MGLEERDDMDLSELRKEYRKASLDIEQANPNPIVQFEQWFDEASESRIPEPNAMCLSTATKEGRPSSRMVLLKYYDEKGFVFFTNYQSRKSIEIMENPYVALLFFWQPLERQVRIEGVVEKISTAASLKYFASRPRGSRIGAWVSAQSSVLTTKKLLLAKFEEMKRKFANREIPLPDHWGGYRVVPTSFEFWQGRENRLHDRLHYDKSGGVWKRELLAP